MKTLIGWQLLVKFAKIRFNFKVILNDDQQDAIILAYLFFPNQLYMFRAMSSPIISSTWPYLQHLMMGEDIAWNM